MITVCLISARYVKWQGMKRGTDYGYSIYEFGVYKNKEMARNPSVVDKAEYPYLSLFTNQYQPISITIVDSNGGKFNIFERCVYVDYYSEGMIESPVYKLNFEFKEPNPKTVTKEQKIQLTNLLGKVEEAIKSGGQSEIKKIMDMNSFAAMYVFEELFKNADYTFDSNYFYIKARKLYAGPIWDMDISMGNVSSVYQYEPYYIYNNKVINGIKYGNGSGDSTEGVWALRNWYEVLMKYDFFKKLVSDKFKQVEQSYEQLYADGGVIDDLVNQYGASFEKKLC